MIRSHPFLLRGRFKTLGDQQPSDECVAAVGRMGVVGGQQIAGRLGAVRAVEGFTEVGAGEPVLLSGGAEHPVPRVMHHCSLLLLVGS